jgi:hypothetical protein
MDGSSLLERKKKKVRTMFNKYWQPESLGNGFGSLDTPVFEWKII